MSCTIDHADLSALLDGELNPLEERRIRQHLGGCPDCRRALESLRRVSLTLKAHDPARNPAPSEEFAGRVIASLPSRSRARAGGRLIAAALRFARTPAVAAAAVLLLVVSLSAVWLAGAVSGGLPAAPGDSGDLAGPDASLAKIRETVSALPGSLGPWPDLGAPRIPDLDLGDPVPPASFPTAHPPSPLTHEQALARLGFSREGERWLTPEGYERLRELIEEEDVLAYAASMRERRSRARPTGGATGPVAAFVASLTPASSHGFGALTLVPLTDGEGKTGVSMMGLAEAFARDRISIKEREGRLTAWNSDPSKFVFLASGAILRGGRQDRILTRGVLIPPKTAASLPVLCCEKDRSTGPSVFVDSPGIAPPGIRRLLVGAASQDEIWNRIATHLGALGVTSKTGALRALYSSGRGKKKVDDYEEALLPTLRGEKVVGFLAWAGGRFLGGELFGSHEVSESLGPRFLRAYILEALLESGGAVAVESADAGRLLATIVRATFVRSPGAVFGEETEFDGGKKGISGFALVPAGAERPLHVSLFPGGTALASGGRAGKHGSSSSRGDAPPPVDPPRDGPPAGSGAERRVDERRRERNKTPKVEPPRPPKSGGSGWGGGGGSVQPKKPKPPKPPKPPTPGGGGGRGRGINEWR